MSRVTPAIVVEAIEASFVWTTQAAFRGNDVFEVSTPELAMIAGLARQVPAELLPVDSNRLAWFFGSLAAIEAKLAQWQGMTGRESQNHPLKTMAALGGNSPVTCLREVLRACPEVAVSRGTHGLSFVVDSQLRDGLRLDLTNADRALHAGDFKSATVLSGSLIEALLLDALHMLGEEAVSVALHDWRVYSGRDAPSQSRSLSASEILDWHLFDLTWTARFAELVSQRAAEAADVARDYRNLIHPGKELREQRPASRGGALVALGAAQLIAEELERWHSRNAPATVPGTESALHSPATAGPAEGESPLTGSLAGGRSPDTNDCNGAAPPDGTAS